MGNQSENVSFFSEKKNNFMHLERHFAFHIKYIKLYFFQKTWEKLFSPVNLGRVGIPLTGVFFIWPYHAHFMFWEKCACVLPIITFSLVGRWGNFIPGFSKNATLRFEKENTIFQGCIYTISVSHKRCISFK